MKTMKLGYPCINRSIGCTANHTFRLASYSREKLIETVEKNLDCLEKILRWNVANGFFFFRISSDIVPFASHPVCRFKWEKHFAKRFTSIGRLIKKSNMRISMHPDQFVLINSPDKNIVKRSFAELQYQAKVLDAMKLDQSAKIQIHVGGVYGEKERAIQRFVSNYKKLPLAIRRRLVVENDERLFSLKNCLSISSQTRIPVLFDSFHHEANNNGESIREAAMLASKTWKKKDGVLMIDYSSQAKGKRKGSHCESIDPKHFKRFIKETQSMDFDLMLEIKDKEKSAKKALEIIKEKKG
jgi:UV DNA damage endonuclease